MRIAGEGIDKDFRNTERKVGLKMAKKRERDGKRTMKFNAQRGIGIEELRGYYFAHGDHGSGSKFNKTVEKIAKYCRVEVSKEIYKLILYGEEAEFQK